MPDIAFDEVIKAAPDCADWLKHNLLKQLETTNAILREAMRIKGLLGIINDNFHARGVGENDILIIASAHLHESELVSNEEPQRTLPKEMRNYKIPAVCKLQAISVSCISFIDYIRNSKAIFR